MPVGNWEEIINLMTGFDLGKRSDILDQKGDGGIPWISVNIKKSTYFDIDSWPRDDGTGWWIRWFEREIDTKYPNVYEANVAFTDTTAGRQYWQRSSDALRFLVQPPYRTAGMSSNYGGSPGQDQGVDLNSFPTLARSFDTAGNFFRTNTEMFKQWLESLGQEDAAWRGTGAGVFYDLINQLYQKYDGFTNELSPPGFSPTASSVSGGGFQSSTLHGDSLIAAEVALHTALQNMYDQFMRFISRSATPIPVTLANGMRVNANVDGDQRNIFLQIFQELSAWVREYNWTRKGWHGGSQQDLPGFSETTVWGNLKDQSTWANIANEAQYRWRENIQVNLDEPARQQVSTLQENWNRVLNPGWNTAFAFDEKTTVSLPEQYQEDKLELEKEQAEEDANQANEDYNNAINDLNNNVNDLGDGLNDLGEGMGDGLNNLGENLGNNFNDLGDGLNNLGDGLNDLGGGLGDGLNNLGDGLNDSLTDLGDGLNNPATLGTDLPTSLDPESLNTDLGTGGTLDPTGSLGDLGDPNTLATDSGGLPDTSSLTDPALTDSGVNPMAVPPLGNLVGTGNNGTGGIPGLTDDPAGLAGSNGSVTTTNPDGSITTEFPDGSSTTVSPNGDVTTTGPDGTISTDNLGAGESLLNPDGSVTSVDANGDITTQFPDGSSVTQNADGSVVTTDPAGNVTTEFPDGSSTTVSPTGDVTTTGPDGTISTDNLGVGESLVNPDGSVTSLDSDGNITTEYPDGSSVTHNADGSITNVDPNGNEYTTMPNGVVETTTPDGLTQLTTPDGTVSTQNADGSLSMEFPDGSSTTITPDGQVTTTTANGSEVTSQLGEGQSLVNPDGSKTTLDPDGGFTTTYPDGSSVTVNPDGTVSSTPATGGTGAGGGLGGIDIPTVSGGTGAGDLPSYDPSGLTVDNGDGSSSTTYPTGTVSSTDPSGYTATNFPDGSSTLTSPDGQFQAVPSPETAVAGGTPDGLTPATGSTGVAPPSGTGDDPGLSALGGLMSPMMMMMGMARMGNQQGQGQGERTRETYQENDQDGAYFHTGPQRPAEPPPAEAFEEEDQDPDEVPSRTPTTGQGSGEGGGWRPETQDSGWDEEDDVWGTGEEGLPASIGR
ncbi:AAWKG family protein [Streptomyces sp. NPDC088387]|uniref:AAWKG family protein n=1 Tax=Streptomyces sp. NPDC088387 TaxID=3365859 RepID=UPI00382351D2